MAGPGPNDYHVKPDSGTAELYPGLGKDEPTDEQRAGVRSASIARINSMKEELKAQGAELTERETALVAKEEATIKRERELEAREKRLQKLEAAADAAAKPKKEPAPADPTK